MKKEDRYEFGRLIGSGMIGIVYLARDSYNDYKPLRCVKEMYKEKIIEKDLGPALKRELQILFETQRLKGCIRLLDVLDTPTSLSFVFPFYNNGDLYNYMKQNKDRNLPE